MSSITALPAHPRRIAVFRALNLGDLLCTVPALRALRQAYPQAWIALVGLKGARPLVRRFHHYLDALLPFPGDPAFPEQPARPDELPRFYRRMRNLNFDLVLQMHGSGMRSNDIAQALGGACWAGFVPQASDEQRGRLMAWPDTLPEIERYLALLTFLGLPASDASLEFPLSADDRHEAKTVARNAGIDPSRTVFFHPGARLESRRWPPERFAAVARALADDGWQIAITGSKEESALEQDLARRLARPAARLCGATSLGGLAALLKSGRLLISNDTGVSHVAAATGLRSVIVACGSDVRRWAPLDIERHVVLHHDTPCRPCAYQRCPVGHPCAQGVSVEQVLAQARKQLAQGVGSDRASTSRSEDFAGASHEQC